MAKRIPKTAARDLKTGDAFALNTSPDSPTGVVVRVEVVSEQFVRLTYTDSSKTNGEGTPMTRIDRMKGHRPYRVIAEASA